MCTLIFSSRQAEMIIKSGHNFFTPNKMKLIISGVTVFLLLATVAWASKDPSLQQAIEMNADIRRLGKGSFYYPQHSTSSNSQAGKGFYYYPSPSSSMPYSGKGYGRPYSGKGSSKSPTSKSSKSSLRPFPPSPSNPSSPSSPTSPSRPSTPTLPTNPSSPTSPSSPSSPIVPIIPSNPSNPSTPTNPTTPGIDIGQCELNDAATLLEGIDMTRDASNACNDDAATLKTEVDEVLEFIQSVSNFADTSQEIVDFADDFLDYASRIAVFTDKVPKYGSIIRRVRRSLRDFVNRLERVIDRFSVPIQSIENGLSNLSSALEHIENFTSSALEILDPASTAVRLAISCSRNNNCLLDNEINDIADLVPLPVLDIAETGFEVCSQVLAPFRDIDIGNLPILPDFSFILDIFDILDAIQGWFREIVGDVAASVDIFLCCDAPAIDDIIEVFNDLIDLLTCPANGILNDRIDQIFSVVENFIQTAISAIIDDGVIAFLDNLSTLDITFDNLELPNLVSLNEDQCEIEFLDVTNLNPSDFGISGSISIDGFPDDFLEFQLNLGDLLDPSNIIDTTSITEACNDAVTALVTNDNPNCCDIARTCDVEDLIILYEGNGCTQNVAGTLGLPPLGQSETTRTGDASCLANDEARSIQLNGPLPEGLRIEVGDNSDNLCADDYAAIVLDRSLGEGESICINSFQVQCGLTASNNDYTIYTYTVNGLDGKISRYEVTNPDPATTIQPFRPRCRNSPITFFEEVGCLQDRKGAGNIPPVGASELRRVRDNDEADSMKLVGPINAGVRIAVFDEGDQDEVCDGDDRASILITEDIAEFEEVCICSFEASETTSKYRFEYFRNNGLLGKVSNYHVFNSGQDVTIPIDPCPLNG